MARISETDSTAVTVNKIISKYIEMEITSIVAWIYLPFIPMKKSTTALRKVDTA